jgi:putative ABC transport system permease protein
MWTHDLRQALRLFRREPGLAATALLTLALGIGANTALFTIIQAVLLSPLPFEDAGRLVILRHRDLRSGLTKPDVAIGDFVDLRARQRSVESLAGFSGFESTLFGEGDPFRILGATATPDALQALRIQPVLGRRLQDGDAQTGAAPAVMISEELWRTQFGSRPEALTRSIQLGGERRSVIGVLPAGFRFPGMTKTDVVVTRPLPAAAPAQRKSGWIYAMGRLQPGRSVADAEAELMSLSAQFARDYPQQNQGSQYEAQLLGDALVGDARQPLVLLLGAVAFVLLIACANVGNLLLARALGRQQELQIRLALGASRWRLVTHLVTEGLALALAGGAAGVALARLATPLLVTAVPNARAIPGLEQIGINSPVVLFALGASVLSALVFSAIGCIGLFRVGRSGFAGERRRTLTPEANRAASALVAAEIALAVVLLAGAGLTLRSFAKLLAVDPGFTASGVLTVQFALPDGRYEKDDLRREFYTQAFERIEALRDVDTVGAAMVTPLTGNNWTVPLQRVDRPVPAGVRPPEVGWQLASQGYFRALRIPLRRGRLFDARDIKGPAAVIVSEAVAARHFAGEDPLGRRVSLGDTTAEIVGVVGDIRRASLTDEPRADLYFPFERVMSPSTTLFIRVTEDPIESLAAVRTVVRALEPHAVLYETRTLSEIAGESAAAVRLATRLLAWFAAMALLLAAVGVYATMSYLVRLRTRELGTRMALGARPDDITRLVLRQAFAIMTVGITAGVAGAMAFANMLSSVLFEVAPWDPATLGTAVGLLGAATMIASYLPARRAARVDPVSVLAAE